MNSDPRWWAVVRAAALVAALLVSVLPAHARSMAEKKQAAEAQYDKAERLREALSGRPAGERSRREYQRAIDAYRRVYYLAPTSPKAEPSVLAVAELMAEEGRAFSDEKLFENAVGQYEFLRREYPGSKHRIEALFTIGQLCRVDLEDDEKAKSAYQEFLKRYPHHHLADDAREAIEDIDTRTRAAAQKSKDKPAEVEARDSAGSRRKGLPLVTGIRHWSTPDYTRIAIDLDQQVKYETGRVPNPDRIFFDLHDTQLAPELVAKSFDVEDGFLRKIRVAQYHRGQTRIVLEVDDVSDYSAFFLPNPYRLIVDIRGSQPGKVLGGSAAPPEILARAAPVVAAKPRADVSLSSGSREKPAKFAGKSVRSDTAVSKPSQEDEPVEVARLDPLEMKATSKPATAPTYESIAPRGRGKRGKQAASAPDPSAHEAKPTSSGEQTLIRALGLKIGRIVVDAGHGGHDTGTIGPNGLEEKDLVLDVALRLGKLLEGRMGADVVYTREDDTFIPLETRTAVANKTQADLFISIHANSSRDAAARGVETYYLNFTSSAGALEVAARENAVSEKSIHELQDLVKKIALKEKIEESREFAANVQRSLQSSPAARGTRDRGIKKAPFIVLIGANMPSILAEISFLSNPADERKLSTPEYRQKIAEALYRGIAKYVSGLSGVRMATKLAKDSGQ